MLEDIYFAQAPDSGPFETWIGMKPIQPIFRECCESQLNSSAATTLIPMIFCDHLLIVGSLAIVTQRVQARRGGVHTLVKQTPLRITSLACIVAHETTF